MKIFKNSLIIFVIAISIYFFIQKKQTKPLDETLTVESIKIEKFENKKADQIIVSTETRPKIVSININSDDAQADEPKKAKPITTNSGKSYSLENEDSEDTKQMLTYTIDDGLAVAKTMNRK